MGKKCANCSREFNEEADYMKDTTRWRKCDMGNLWFNCNCGSTLMLKKGKFEWYSPDKFMSDDAASVFNRLANMDSLPHFPAGVMQLSQLLQDADSDTKDIADCLKGTPLIATNLLQIASNMSTAGRKVENLQHAITYLGRQEVQRLVLVASMKTFKFKTKVFSESKFWAESLSTAIIGERMTAKFAKHLNKEEVYLAGALCNLGKIVAAITMPDTIEKIAEIVNDEDSGRAWTDVEKEYEDANHSLLGEIGASLWGLPEYVAEAASSHHDPRQGDEVSLSEVVSLANQLTHFKSGETHRIDNDLVNKLKGRLGLSTQDFDDFIMDDCEDIEDLVSKQQGN